MMLEHAVDERLKELNQLEKPQLIMKIIRLEFDIPVKLRIEGQAVQLIKSYK